MKPILLIPVLSVALCVGFAAHAMQVVPYGPNTGSQFESEPNRLSKSKPGQGNNWGNNNWGSRIDPFTPPGLSLAPSDLQPPPERRDTGPGFLNADPFDPNSVVNRYERSLWANPYPYDPVYNPYGQGSSNYAPHGGADVPMGNGIRYGR
jgi:hypothetical protein